MIEGKNLSMEGFSDRSHHKGLQISAWQNGDRCACVLSRA